MKTHLPVRINDIAAATGLSRATIDRVMKKAPWVHPRTQAHVLRVNERLENGELLGREEVAARELRATYQMRIVIQAGKTFTRILLDAASELFTLAPGTGCRDQRRLA